MGLNIGYLTCDKTENGDEVYTPYYAVEPILEFIPKDKTIWCPFDEEWSAFYQTFKKLGYNVIRSSIVEGQDFFKYEPKEHYDIIVSNPPFSKKDEILKRCDELKKPFALILPIASLQSKKRFDVFIKGLELLVLNERIDFHTNSNFKEYTKGVHFGSAYFCRNLLPEKLIFRELHKYNKPLK